MLEHLIATPLLYTFGRQGVLIFVIVPTIVGAGFYFAGQRFNIVILKILALISLLAGMGLGVFAILKLQDPIYASYYDLTSRSELLHYAIFVMPLLGAIALGVLEFIFRRNVHSRI